MNLPTDVITSRQNRTVVELCKLSDRRTREETKTFRFDGVKLFYEAMQKGVEILLLILRESSALELWQQIKTRLGEEALSRIGRVILVSDGVFEKISEEKSPEGMISVAKYIDKFQKIVTIYNSTDFFKMKNERILLLESVRDPANLGTIVRSAAALGIDRIICSSDCADIYHPKALRASMGALFDQPIDRAADLPSAIKGLLSSGRRVFAATLDARAKELGSFRLLIGDCVVIGNEGHGLSPETVNACTGSVIIPQTARAESLNAAAAAAILIWEFSKVQ